MFPHCRLIDGDDVWASMHTKENTYERDSSFLDRHPDVTTGNRVLLVDWIKEVQTRRLALSDV